MIKNSSGKDLLRLVCIWWKNPTNLAQMLMEFDTQGLGITRLADLPMDWAEQRRQLGI